MPGPDRDALATRQFGATNVYKTINYPPPLCATISVRSNEQRPVPGSRKGVINIHAGKWLIFRGFGIPDH